MGDAGASALAAALGRGALPRLQLLALSNAAIGDAGLVALAPALRRLPALEVLHLWATRSATRASPPSWHRHHRRVCCRRRLVGWRSSRSSTSSTPSSPTPAAPPSPLRSTAARFRGSRCSIWLDIPASAAAIATVYEARPHLKKLEWEQLGPESDDEEGEESEEDGEEDE